MWSLTCDHCKKPIDQIGYVIRAVAVDDPEHVVSRGPTVHYECIVPYIQKDK